MENRETQDRKCIEKMGILLNHPEGKKMGRGSRKDAGAPIRHADYGRSSVITNPLGTQYRNAQILGSPCESLLCRVRRVQQ